MVQRKKKVVTAEPDVKPVEKKTGYFENLLNPENVIRTGALVGLAGASFYFKNIWKRSNIEVPEFKAQTSGCERTSSENTSSRCSSSTFCPKCNAIIINVSSSLSCFVFEINFFCPKKPHVFSKYFNPRFSQPNQ